MDGSTFLAVGGSVSSSIMIIPPSTITFEGAVDTSGEEKDVWMSIGKWSTRIETAVRQGLVWVGVAGPARVKAGARRQRGRGSEGRDESMGVEGRDLAEREEPTCESQRLGQLLGDLQLAPLDHLPNQNELVERGH